MNKSSKIYIAGHTGLVGSAVMRHLKSLGFKNLLCATRDEVDLLNQAAVEVFFKDTQPEYVIDCAARVGGIKANMTSRANFLYENLQIQNNLMWAAHNHGVKKFLFLGSSCIYPRECPQPMKEEYFMTGRPEPTNEGYAYAKIVGMKLCELIYDQYDKSFISCMPTNIYGPGDNFDPESSHVIPSLIRRIHEAKQQNIPSVEIWGTGNARREFLHVDDLAASVIWMLENYSDKQFLNIGTGEDVSIRELSTLIQSIIGYKGELVFDATKPDGMPRKLLDVSKVNEMGWHHKIKLEEGLRQTYDWYQRNVIKV